MGEEATWPKMSIVRGHHVYKKVWTPYIGQSLHDHAVCVRKANGTVVGHAPQEMSCTFWHFLRHRGRIECEMAVCLLYRPEKSCTAAWWQPFTYCTCADNNCNLHASGSVYMILNPKIGQGGGGSDGTLQYLS